MSASIRCFIAVKLSPPGALRRVLKELAEMGRPIKAVEPENLHATLKFLGETDRKLLADIGSVLANAARKRERCLLRVTGLGVFPHARRPSVIWTGLEGAESLVSLAGDLEAELEPYGFARESRPFVPHLTLARVKAKPPEAFFDLLARHAKTAFGTMAIEHVELFQSELGPAGSKYSVLSSAPLGQSE